MKRYGVRDRFVALVAVGWLAACATPQSDPPLTDHAPPAAQRCQMVRVPDPLPPVSAVLDTAAMSAARSPDLSAGYAVFSLKADSSDSRRPVLVIESDLAPDRQTATAALVTNHLRRADGVRRMRLRIDFGSKLTFTLGASQDCAPAVSNTSEIRRQLTAASRKLDFSGTVTIHVRTNEQGRPERVLVYQSSGRTTVDEAAVRIGKSMKFHPALVDGVPELVWSEIPLHFFSDAHDPGI